MAKTFDELFAEAMEYRKSHPMYGGTFEIHYRDPQMGKMVAYVEAYSEKKSGVRKAAIEKAKEEQMIDPETIIEVRRYD